jgi:hypothetical protein
MRVPPPGSNRALLHLRDHPARGDKRVGPEGKVCDRRPALPGLDSDLTRDLEPGGTPLPIVHEAAGEDPRAFHRGRPAHPVADGGENITLDGDGEGARGHVVQPSGPEWIRLPARPRPEARRRLHGPDRRLDRPLDDVIRVQLPRPHQIADEAMCAVSEDLEAVLAGRGAREHNAHPGHARRSILHPHRLDRHGGDFPVLQLPSEHPLPERILEAGDDARGCGP